MSRSRFLILSLMVLSSISMFSQSKWNLNIGFGTALNTGNVNYCNIINDAFVSRNDEIIQLDFHYKLLYSSMINRNNPDHKWEETNFEINGGVKLDLFQYDKFSPFLACEMLTNKYKGYDLKMSGLLGVKYRFFTKPSVYDYSISGAFVYDNTDFTDETHLPNINYRISIRPKIKQKIVNNLVLIHYTFYQPSVLDWNDFIICSVTKLRNKITNKLFIDLSFTYEYRSLIPSSAYKHEDILTEVSIRFKI